METIYDVDYFIKKLESISDVQWFVGNFYDDVTNPTKKCALGHCGVINSSGYSFTREADALCALFSTFFAGAMLGNVADVNDGKNPSYQQPTPKERVLTCLYDIYENTYGRKYGEEPKEKIVYKTVVIDSEVKAMTEKELCQQ